MRITQAELNRYRLELGRRSDAAKAYVAARVRDECVGLPVAEARQRAIEIVGDCNGVFGEQAQALAADLFDEVCSAEGIDAASELFDDVIDYGSMDEKVRYYAGGLKDGDIGGFAGSLSDLAAFYVKRSAYENMVRNCDRNNDRYARVATGRETCGWCFMLSSRGFVYHSEQTAEHGMHAHCDCIVVPGRRGTTKIQGYDPEGMRRRWAMCVDASGGYPDGAEIRARWEALADEERAAYRGGWKRFSELEYSRAARTEAELRDPMWLYSGKPSAITYETEQLKDEIRSKRPHEEMMAILLSENGFPVYMRESSSVKRIADSEVHGTTWEFKAPCGNGYLTIKNQIKSNLYGNDHSTLKPQSPRMVISNVRSPMTFDEMVSGLDVALDPDEGLKQDEILCIDEVVLLDKSGRMLRVKTK